MRRGFCLALIAAGSLLIFSGIAGAETPLLVSQPFYDGMQFYVYQPSGVPAGWYATYDGYLVYKDGGGVWRYGSKNGADCVATDYIVGAVVPSLLGLTPVAKNSAGVLPSSPAVDISMPGRAFWPEAPSWTRDPAFLAVGKWEKSVDRIGVLSKPAAPVAWSGDHPKVLYVWTGRRWHQITLKEDWPNPFSALKSQLYNLTVQVNKSGTAWRGEDTAALISYAAKWGYGWMGQINLLRPSWLDGYAAY